MLSAVVTSVQDPHAVDLYEEHGSAEYMSRIEACVFDAIVDVFFVMADRINPGQGIVQILLVVEFIPSVHVGNLHIVIEHVFEDGLRRIGHHDLTFEIRVCDEIWQRPTVI